MGPSEKIYNDGDEFFGDLIQSLMAARKIIQFETYIFDQDQLGFQILDVLSAAVARGVRVQLLLDGVGSSAWTFSEAEKWRLKGIELKFFHALPWQQHRSFFFQLFSLKRLALGFFKLKHRNHRKTCIIDDEITFVGSMNVSVRHLPSVFGILAWRDAAARIIGVDSQRYRLAFSEAWNFSQNHYGQRWLKISQQKKRIHRQLIHVLRSAKRRVWITNPYFVPDFKLTGALCAAARRGVDVQILLPGRSDIFGIKFAMEGYYSLLLSLGIKIFEYSPSILHAKILIIDDWVSLGSSNLDPRSIFYNLEIDAILTEAASIQIIESQFKTDLQASKQIQFDVWKKRSWFSRQIEKFFLYFRGSL